MEPTYMNGDFNFCFKLRYIFSKPERHDVVAIRLAGEKVILLKRVVALEGEVVEIQKGNLFVIKYFTRFVYDQLGLNSIPYRSPLQWGCVYMALFV